VLERIVATAVVTLVAMYSGARYSHLNGSYDRTRPPVRSDRVFQQVYKILVAFALIVAIGAFWSNAHLLGKIREPAWLCPTGLLVSIAGAVFFELAVRALGSQYSPCFDLRLPAFRITRGPYRLLSHPIYVGNLAILLGVFVACGSLWVLLVGCIVGVFYLRSARTERRLLEGLST